MTVNGEESELTEKLTILNRISQMNQVQQWLEHLTQHFQLPDKVVFKLDLVLNEALINIIEYAYKDDANHLIEIFFKDAGEFVELEILDDGMLFDPFAEDHTPEQCTLETALPNGRGIHLIQAFTDAQEYRNVNGLNFLRIIVNKPIESSMPHQECQTLCL